MVTTRHMHVEAELARWMILILAALALVLAATTLAAADPTKPPRLLPPEIAKLAKPIAAVDPAPPFFPEAPPAREFPPAEAAARLWRILELARRAAQAARVWSGDKRKGRRWSGGLVECRSQQLPNAGTISPRGAACGS